MEENIEDMEPRGPHAVEEAVPAECEHGEGAVGFVRFGVREGKPPEVIAEDLRKRCVTPARKTTELMNLYIIQRLGRRSRARKPERGCKYYASLNPRGRSCIRPARRV